MSCCNMNCLICGKVKESNYPVPDEFKCKCSELKVLAKPIEELENDLIKNFFSDNSEQSA